MYKSFYFNHRIPSGVKWLPIKKLNQKEKTLLVDSVCNVKPSRLFMVNMMCIYIREVPGMLYYRCLRNKYGPCGLLYRK